MKLKTMTLSSFKNEGLSRNEMKGIMGGASSAAGCGGIKCYWDGVTHNWSYCDSNCRCPSPDKFTCTPPPPPVD